MVEIYNVLIILIGRRRKHYLHMVHTQYYTSLYCHAYSVISNTEVAYVCNTPQQQYCQSLHSNLLLWSENWLVEYDNYGLQIVLLELFYWLIYNTILDIK